LIQHFEEAPSSKAESSPHGSSMYTGRRATEKSCSAGTVTPPVHGPTKQRRTCIKQCPSHDAVRLRNVCDKGIALKGKFRFARHVRPSYHRKASHARKLADQDFALGPKGQGTPRDRVLRLTDCRRQVEKRCNTLRLTRLAWLPERNQDHLHKHC